MSINIEYPHGDGMKGQIGLIFGIIALIVIAIFGIWMISSIIQIFTLAITAVVICVSFLWLWAMFKKEFNLDKYMAAGLALVISVFLGVAVYQSIWYIIGLGIIVGIGYGLWKYFNQKISMFDILRG